MFTFYVNSNLLTSRTELYLHCMVFKIKLDKNSKKNISKLFLQKLDRRHSNRQFSEMLCIARDPAYYRKLKKYL